MNRDNDSMPFRDSRPTHFMEHPSSASDFLLIFFFVVVVVVVANGVKLRETTLFAGLSYNLQRVARSVH